MRIKVCIRCERAKDLIKPDEWKDEKREGETRKEEETKYALWLK